MKISRIFDNLGVKLACLLLAIIVWLYASKPEGTEAIDKFMKIISRDNQGKTISHEVPVKLVGTEENWKADPEKISLEVEYQIEGVNIDNLQAVVYLTRRDEENGNVTLTAENTALPKGLLFVKAEPKTVKITPIP